MKNNRRAKSAAVLLALSLGAAACGADAPTTTQDASDAPTTTAEESASEETTESAESDSAVSDDAASDEADDPVSDGADESGSDDSGAAEDAPPVANLFPDVDVIDIPTGSTVNLSAELAGGETPVLLWFWAPH